MIKTSLSYIRSKYAEAEESLAQAAARLEQLVQKFHSLDKTGLQELQKELPEYGKIRKYIQENVQEGYPTTVQEIEGEHGLPLIFKAILVTQIREMQAKVEHNLEQASSREEVQELQGIAKRLDQFEKSINRNIHQLESTETMIEQGGGGDDFAEQGGRLNLQKAEKRYKQEHGIPLDQEMPDELREDFIMKYVPALREKAKREPVSYDTSREVEEIKRLFEEALNLVEIAKDEISVYEGYFSEIEQEARDTGYVAAFTQAVVPANMSIEDFLARKGDSIGRVWHKSQADMSNKPSGNGVIYHFEGRIPKDSIDWGTMRKLYSNPNGPHNSAIAGEIYLTKGAPIQLHKIYKVSPDGTELEVPIGRSVARAENLVDFLKIAISKFEEYEKKMATRIMEDRKEAPETPAPASPAAFNADCGMYNEEVVSVDCPACGGPGEEMGALGKKVYYRCRNCGSDFPGDANADYSMGIQASAKVKGSFRSKFGWS